MSEPIADGNRNTGVPVAAGSPGQPAGKDVAVRYTVDERGKPVIESVTPIFRPPELLTQPIKRHWAYIWAVIIVLVIVAWIFLFSYFSVHQAPYSAPVR